MKETTNYKLKKPDKKEFYNIDIFNENADLIDKELYNSSKKIENLEETLINNLNEKHKNFEEKYNKNLEEQNKKIDDNSKNDSRYFRRDLGSVKDFNEAKTEGIYSVSGNILNSPQNLNYCFGRLNVYVRDKDITQMLITHDNRIFLRFCNNGTEWRTWNKVFSDVTKPTWSDIQAKPSTFEPSKHNHDDSYIKKDSFKNNFLDGMMKGYNFQKIQNTLMQYGSTEITIKTDSYIDGSYIHFPLSFKENYICTGNASVNDFLEYSEINVSFMKESEAKVYVQITALNGKMLKANKKVTIYWLAVGK